MESIAIQMPHPCPSRDPAGQAKLMCLTDNQQWEDITDRMADFVVERQSEHQSFINFHIRHFCG
jgi:hypothetical protein